MSWRPFLPEPRPAYKDDPRDPEPVPLQAVRAARDLCAGFRIPPARFRRRVPRGSVGAYTPATDTVAVDPNGAASEGMGGEDGYYVALLEELLHATGHPSRLGRPTTGDFPRWRHEEATVGAALRTVLEDLGFPDEALEWYAPAVRTQALGVPADQRAAAEAAAWLLGR